MSSHRPFACDVCSQTFTRNENLERHRRSRHGDDSRKPFECTRCQSRFSRRDVCKRHAETCRGTRPSSVADRADDDPIHPITASGEGSVPVTGLGTTTSPDIGLGSPILNEPEGLSSLTDTWLRPTMQGHSSHSGIDVGSMDDQVAAYFECFHPSFPMLHQPTFNNRSPKILRNIVVAIGSLYTAQTLPEEDSISCIRGSHDLWDAGRQELTHMVDLDWAELRKPWAMQAWLLHIIYGAYMGDAARYSIAKKMLRLLVDAVQDFGLLRQAVATSGSQPWLIGLDRTRFDGGAQTLHGLWILYVEEESMKLAMYAVLFLDFHILSPCNIRPLISPLELGWELPLSSSLWESNTALAWRENLSEDPRIAAMLEPNETLGFPCPTTTSLTLATQSLMSESPSPYLLAALEASPIATLFVVTNIDSFVRDFTRCYYQLPPNLPDPSAFHIFTQNQNRQINAALQHINRIIDERNPSVDDSDRLIWTAVERLALAVKIALCKPDDLLVGGIVDSSVVAGLATATHLTLGLYAGSRRSLQSLLQRNSGDDAVLMILDEVMSGLSSICRTDPQDALREAPWMTVAAYRIILPLWRSFRWAATEMRAKSGQVQVPKRFQAAKIIHNSISEAALPQGGHIESTDASEASFTKTVSLFWKERHVWALGVSMATVLDEIISSGY